ncbi:MAG: MOSC domain-containing protein [Alphaproteobacteria bacterium]|nr:MOSC domain-containing protein [Alphaproteobacteria bacterium]
MKVVSLHLYPVKGTRAFDVERAQLAERGFEGDRRWLVVDSAGIFATQRSHAVLAAIQATPSARGLHLKAGGMPDLEVSIPDGSKRGDVTIWDAQVDAALADDAAHAWLTQFFGEDMRLVYMDAKAERLKQGIWAPPLPVSFADGYPVLIATTGSLAAVNAEIARKGGAPVTMRRFRPNIVLDCPDPWAEDFWKRLKIGTSELELIKPCDRCIVTTKDQLTGATTGDEPLGALRTLRMSADPRIKGVLFGWNSLPRVLGEIAVGDAAEIVERRPEGFAIHAA